MKRILLAAIALALLLPAGASAHPLGNFSINHLDQLKVSSGRIDVTYILDQAEIPTFQERGLAPSVVLARKKAEVERGLVLTVGGRHVPLAFAGPGQISFPPGQGGLKLTRVVLPLSAGVSLPRSVLLHDGTFPGRIGWKAIVAQPGSGTAVRSSVPSGDPTDGLRAYPQDMLKSPLDQRDARLGVGPGDGSLIAPKAPGAGDSTTHNRSGDGFAGVFADAAAGRGVLVFFLLAAFAWGAMHALSPGHGKTMVAAYLVGTRGTARHAVALGATVTITHTIGVFALGLVTLLLSQWILPEQLYPWLNLASGLMVVGIGAAVLRTRVRRSPFAVGRSPFAVRRSGAHSHHHHDHSHHHHHDHHPANGERSTANDTATPSMRGLLTMGASAGLIPCPSALVVLLGAVSQHQLALGLLLITMFSLGLAGTLTGLGLLVVSARRLTTRLDLSGRLVGALPAVSALVIVGAGCVLTAHAVPQIV
jgi:ABC-type nickel/cobalt efflux system permease component RcnA